MDAITVAKAQIRKTVDGSRVYLQGVNLGGWLMPEAYFMHAPNRGYRFFKAEFSKALGAAEFSRLERAFRDTFVTADDLARIAALGFNCVRLPFHYEVIESQPFVYAESGLRYLDQAIRWAKDCGMWVILDLHAVPGAQNHDWHSDSDGRAEFWTNKDYQRRAIALWEMLADRYKDEPTVAGYDLLNESVVEDAALLNAYYQAAIKAIRRSDRQHIIFVEGNRWAQDLECLDHFEDDKVVLSMHFYEPIEFTFHWVPLIKYPLAQWDRGVMRQRLEQLKAVADQRGRALWCGEYGVNAREGLYGEQLWLSDMLRHFQELNIHSTYWTWKAIKNHMFPDGIYSYIPNDPWINRQGPVTGWDTWKDQWPQHRERMMASWKTENFTLNAPIAAVFKNARPAGG